MKSVLYFMSFVVAATALLAACGKSGGSNASVPNNCGISQGYSSQGGCLQMNAPQCLAQGQQMGLSSAGTCLPAECVNNGAGCVAGGYYNNGTYTNGYYGYGGSGYSGYGYGSGYGYSSYPAYNYYNGYNIAYPYSGGGYSGYGYGYPSSGVSGGFYIHF